MKVAQEIKVIGLSSNKEGTINRALDILSDLCDDLESLVESGAEELCDLRNDCATAYTWLDNFIYTYNRQFRPVKERET